MTVLSQIRLNPRHRQVQRDAADCQALHATVMRAFSSVAAPARSALGLLYRVEAQHGAMTLLAQSSAQPNWAALPSGYVMTAAVKDVTAAYSAITPGQVLRFRLRANPTRRICTPEGKGKRVELFREPDQLAWLERKGETGGFSLICVTASPGLPISPPSDPPPRAIAVQALPGHKMHGWRADGGERRRLTFGSVLFEGELRVSDHDAFLRTVLSGVGSAKAYGFGLLSIAPPR